ncbi:MAG: GtrA family protein [Sulfurospirillaceae bacterium]|nr:GtrA family protein [Sulfurospirillaceae bacterium]
MISHKKLDIHQLKRFIISGGTAVVFHLGTMALLVWLGVNASLSTSAGVIVGAVVNYIFQYYYTFDSDEKHNSSVFKYIITVSISFVSNLILFTLFHNLLHNGVIVSQLLTSAIVALQNYLIYKKFVFLRQGVSHEA